MTLDNIFDFIDKITDFPQHNRKNAHFKHLSKTKL